MTFTPSRTIQSLILFGLGHFVVETVSAGILFANLTNLSPTSLSLKFYFILYLCCSFAIQSIFGLVVDKLKAPVFACLLGIGLLLIPLSLSSFFPVFSIMLAALGNALFHVGGGSISLTLTPNKAFGPGMFVAPGAIGLLLGTLIGKFLTLPISWFQLALVALGLAIYYFKTQPRITLKPIKLTRYFSLGTLFLTLSISIRGFIGLSLPYAWKSQTYLLVLLTLMVFLGKVIGGYAADRFGWARVSVLALVISAPLAFLGVTIPVMGLAGTFFFNMTMAVTITAIANLIPNRPAFAFGLGSLSLAVGALPIYLSFPVLPVWSLVTLTFFSALLLYFSLNHLNQLQSR